MLLTSLPNELLTRILEFVDAACPLTRVSLTCKALNDVAEPLLYRSFCQQDASSMGLLARAIISRPRLARYVRNFEGSIFRPDLKIPDTTREGINLRTISQNYPTSKQLHDLRASLPDVVYGEEWCTAWYGGLTNWFDNWDAFLGFLFQICSRNLTHIVLQSPGPLFPYLRRVLHQAIEEQNSSAEQAMLSNLRKVDLKFDDKANKSGHGLGIDTVLPFFSLKSVDTISVSMFSTHFALTPEFSEQHCFTIKHLTLTDSRIPATSLETLLSCFNSLQYFEYEHASLRAMGGTQFRPNIIANGLQRSKHCLECLHFSQSCPPARLFTTSLAIVGLESVTFLKNFQRLRILRVDARVLLGFEHYDTQNKRLLYAESQLTDAVTALPVALESLHIIKYGSSIFDFLEHILPTEGPSPSPKLRSIRLIDEWEDPDPEPSLAWEQWKQRALKKGITLSRSELHP